MSSSFVFFKVIISWFLTYFKVILGCLSKLILLYLAITLKHWSRLNLRLSSYCWLCPLAISPIINMPMIIRKIYLLISGPMHPTGHLTFLFGCPDRSHICFRLNSWSDPYQNCPSCSIHCVSEHSIQYSNALSRAPKLGITFDLSYSSLIAIPSLTYWF